ncbi:hypothetical protein ESY86_20495 [Subsaximicrobium wynnwilliamsii]|uniref:Uncharacterized protein n=1 Tax=Subsaximicrobium wynnwilliamsii TaxID=291179 RepID=A0A5C6ZA66_9FLAO|nr:hypothetical protein [Subsaximicrobium wynnwilliamsii]TXD80880.1 hypothetical protein ESY87_19950 [Subsaximicrobium wynnwilliamsii]TXD86224.1 hypothetical protein ESY86_20495 [Subsaximicrobium wynnwilliamsii]TXD99598.1 hypothetical protein ESY88_20515 [Subsaximicrobium wynnwilliamsii]
MEELFNDFTNQTGIELPQSIIKYYLDGRNSNSQFVRLFKSNFDSVEKRKYPYLKVLLSEMFAREILTLIHEYSYDERINDLFYEIYNYHYKDKQIIFDTNKEDFVIDEIFYATIDYNYKKNQFKFPLIQNAYEKLDSNPEFLKVILILHGSCGGDGGIIVRGKNIGYDSGYIHGEKTEVEFNDKIFEYNGYSFENYEKIHKVIEEKFK